MATKSKSKTESATVVILPSSTPENFNADVYGILYDAARYGAASAAAMEEAKRRGEGCYSSAVKAAAMCRECAEFTETIGALEEMIRTNANVAKAIGAKTNKDGTGWVIPGSLMNAKSIIVAAFGNGVALADNGEPRAFSAIREDVNKAKAAKAAAAEKAKAETDPHLADFVAIRDTLAAMAEALPKTLPEGYPELRKLVEAARAYQLTVRKPDAAKTAAATLAAAMLPNGRAAGQTKATAAA